MTVTDFKKTQELMRNGTFTLRCLPSGNFRAHVSDGRTAIAWDVTDEQVDEMTALLTNRDKAEAQL